MTHPRSAQNCSSARIMCWSERLGSGADMRSAGSGRVGSEDGRVYAAGAGPASRSVAVRARRFAGFQPTQHLERAQALEALEVGAEEVLDDAQQLARARQRDVLPGFEQRPRQEQRDRKSV